MNRFIILVLGLISFVISGQNNTIAPGEKLTFTASYNMSGLLTDFAQITMETTTFKTSKSEFLRLRCKAQTYEKWNQFFAINDTYETFVNPTNLEPYIHKRQINEGGYFKKMQYNFDSKSQSVKSVKTKRRKDGTFWDEKNTFRVSERTKDIITTLYALRNSDIHKAKIGTKDRITVLFDNKETEITIALIAIETIDTKLGMIKCYKVGVSLQNSEILNNDNDNVIWLTADKNKVPVYVKFKVPVGNGELKIQHATGLKF